MPTIKVYRNGASSYMGGTGTHKRAPRGVVKGWTPATARRQVHFLWTVDSDELTGAGYAVTLTLRDCPPDAATFHRMRKAYLMRLERMGATRVHWVIEWQARGVPHLHAAVYFEETLSFEQRMMLVVNWLTVSDEFGSTLSGQHVDVISGPLGWLKYLAKHASRGAMHYQRQGAPEGWEKTGRMWGKGGEWPVVEPVELEGLNNREFWRVRRIMRKWAVAQAAAAVAADPSDVNRKRLRALRRAPKIRLMRESSYLGASEWIDEATMLRLVDYFERESA